MCGLLLTPSRLRIPYRRFYYTHEYCKEKGYDHRTQAELGEDMAVARVVVLGDTAYEAKCVLAGPKARPKLRSLLQDISKQRFIAVKVHPGTDPYSRQRRWSESARDRTNKERTYWACKKRVDVHSVGVVSVFVSTTKKPEAGRPLHEPKILLTHPSLTRPARPSHYSRNFATAAARSAATSNGASADPALEIILVVVKTSSTAPVRPHRTSRPCRVARYLRSVSRGQNAMLDR